MTAKSILLPFPVPQIESAVIHFPDESDWGTGTFTVNVRPSGLPPAKLMTAAGIVTNRFQITVAFNVNKRIAVNVGVLDPAGRAIYILPPVAPELPHTFVVMFARWHLLGATLDGITLAEEDAGSVN